MTTAPDAAGTAVDTIRVDPADRDRPRDDRFDLKSCVSEGSEPQAIQLSIVILAHDDEQAIARAVSSLASVNLPCPFELIIMALGNMEHVRRALEGIGASRVPVVRYQNQVGKRSTLLTAASAAHGTHLLVFDADQYDPRDVPRMVDPLVSGTAEIVFGTRILGMNTVHPSFTFALGNKATTLAANLLYDACICDLHSGLKLLPLDLLRSLNLAESDSGVDTEMTAKLLRRGLRPFEICVSYFGRPRSESKYATWLAGVECLVVLAKVRIGKEARPAPVPSPVLSAREKSCSQDKPHRQEPSASTTQELRAPQ